MQTEQSEIVVAALDNLVRYSVTGCGRAARRAADLLEQLAEASGLDSGMRRMCALLSEALAKGVTEATMRPAASASSRAWLTWEWLGGSGQPRNL